MGKNCLLLWLKSWIWLTRDWGRCLILSLFPIIYHTCDHRDWYCVGGNKRNININIYIFRNFSNPRSLILEQWTDQIHALLPWKSGPSTWPWPCCWTRAITAGVVLRSRRKEVAVSLSLFIAFSIRPSSSGCGESINNVHNGHNVHTGLMRILA